VLLFPFLQSPVSLSHSIHMSVLSSFLSVFLPVIYLFVTLSPTHQIISLQKDNNKNNKTLYLLHYLDVFGDVHLNRALASMKW
jgi:hypothetical protein